MSEENQQKNEGTAGPVERPESAGSPAKKTVPRRRATDFVSPSLVDYEPPVLHCLAVISGIMGRPVSTVALKAGMPQGSERPPLATCIRAAEHVGLTVRTLHKPKISSISSLTMPCILVLIDDQACILLNVKESQAEVIFPQEGGGSSTLSLERLQEQYSGYALLVRPEAVLDKRASELKLFDTREWFWGTILRFLPIYKHVLVATFIINLIGIATPFYILSIYDRVVPNNAFDTLWALSIGVMLAYVFEFILRNLRSYFTDVAGRNADVIIASKLLQQMTAMRLDHKPDSAGTLANNLREFETLRDFFSSTTLMALVDIPFIFVFIALAAYVGGPLALAPLLALPIVVLFGYFIQQPFQRVAERSYREGSQKNALLVEAISGIETIKTSMAEGQIQKRWEEIVGLNSRSVNRARALSTLSISFSQFTTNVVNVVVVIGGVYMIAEGDLTLGGLIACRILAGRSMSPIGAVAGLLTRFQQSRMALKSLDLLMHQPNERPADKVFIHAQSLEPTIAFEKVRFRYPNSQSLALDDVTLSISPGEKVGIIGRTGSGKSTLGRLCLGLYEPLEGSVKLGGIDLRQLHVADLRHRIGYVSQDNFLFYGTVRENISFGAPYVDGKAILRAANIAGVTDFVRKHPSGFDWQVGERGMNLSGGQRQAITIARALLLDPQILVLDEPTSAMDNASEAQFRQRLETALDGKTLLLCTHRTSMLQLVDRLVVIDGGKVVADGPKAEMLKALRAGKIAVAR